MLVFKTSAFNRSATLPRGSMKANASRWNAGDSVVVAGVAGEDGPPLAGRGAVAAGSGSARYRPCGPELWLPPGRGAGVGRSARSAYLPSRRCGRNGGMSANGAGVYLRPEPASALGGRSGQPRSDSGFRSSSRPSGRETGGNARYRLRWQCRRERCSFPRDGGSPTGARAGTSERRRRSRRPAIASVPIRSPAGLDRGTTEAWPALTANRPSGRCSPPYGTAGLG